MKIDYRSLRAPVLSAIVVVLIIFMGFPLSYGAVLIGFFWLRTLNVASLIEKKIHEIYPDFINHHDVVRRAVPFIVYIALILSLKFIIIDVAMGLLLHIPARQELAEFVARLSG